MENIVTRLHPSRPTNLYSSNLRSWINAASAMEADYSLIAFLPYQTFHEAKKHRQQQGGVISFTREEAFLVSSNANECGGRLVFII